MRNIWKKGSLRNPYYVNAFKAAGISPVCTNPVEIGQKLEERKAAVRNVPGYFKIGNRELTESDVTEAGQILLDPINRMLEELLEHKPEEPDYTELQGIVDRLPSPDWPVERSFPDNFRFLFPVIKEYVRNYLKQLPPTQNPPFPVDTTVIPPFGINKDTDNDQD